MDSKTDRAGESAAASESRAPEAAGVTRRDFVKGAGAAAAAFSVLTANKSRADEAPQTVEAATTANDKINIALIGVGGRGSSLLGQALQMKNYCQVVAVCDVYARRRERAVETCAKKGVEVKAYLNWQDVLDRPDVDAVFIATPDHWHATIAIAAMKKGKDVYCEKPMAHTIAEAKEMAETEASTGRIVQIGSQTTSSSQWWKAKQAIADGMIGKLLMSQGSYHRNSEGGEWNYGIDPHTGPDKTGPDHIDWDMWQQPAKNHVPWNPPRFFRFRKYWDYSGGIATDLFFHVVAPMNICWPAPEFPWRVSGMGGIYSFDDGREVPDTFHMIADYPSGHSLVLSSSMANSTHIPGLIRGHEGTIMMVEGGQFESVTPFITVTPEDIGDAKKNFVAKYGTEKLQITTPAANPVGLHFKNFFECIKSREKTHLPAATAYRVQVAINLAMLSYQNGQVMFFDSEKQVETDRRPANTMGLDKSGVLKGADVKEPGYNPADFS